MNKKLKTVTLLLLAAALILPLASCSGKNTASERITIRLAAPQSAYRAYTSYC